MPAGLRDRGRAHGGAELVRELLGIEQERQQRGAFLLVVDLPEAETVDALQLVLELLLLRAERIEDAVELPPLGDCDRAGQLVHPHVHADHRAVADLDAHPAGLMALIVETEGTLIQLVTRRADEAAVAGGDGLEDVEGICAHIADGAHALPMICRADSLAAVFNDVQVMLLRDLHDGIHIAGVAQHMDRHDGLRLRGDERFDLRGVDGQRLVDLREDGDGVHHGDGRDGGDEGIAGDDDLVAHADAERRQAAHQRARARARGDHMLVTQPLCHFIFERDDLRLEAVHARRAVAEQISPIQHIQYFLALFRAQYIRSRSACHFVFPPVFSS